MGNYEKPDFWSIKAQKEHYPARSIYKLKEIDEKFGFFKSAPRIHNSLRVLDLGAAPGSWSLYVLRRQRGPLFLAAVDLLPLSGQFDGYGGDTFFFIQGDFTGEQVRNELTGLGPYSAIISDAAPATTGSRTVDTQRSIALAEEAFSYAEKCLAPGGNLAVKVFQGSGTAELLTYLKRRFTSAKSFKPAASRGSSFETYFLGLGKSNNEG